MVEILAYTKIRCIVTLVQRSEKVKWKYTIVRISQCTWHDLISLVVYCNKIKVYTINHKAITKMASQRVIYTNKDKMKS